MNGMLARVSKKFRENPNSGTGNYLEVNELYGTHSTDIVIKDENIFDRIKEGDIIFVIEQPIFDEDKPHYGHNPPTLLCLIKDLEKLI